MYLYASVSNESSPHYQEKGEISSTMEPTESEPAAALVTMQPTNTWRLNVLCSMTLQHPRSLILKPSSLYFSSVSNMVVLVWAGYLAQYFAVGLMSSGMPATIYGFF